MAHSVYLVLEGDVELSKKSDCGRQIHLTTIKEGDFFGDLGVFSEQPRLTRASALTYCRRYSIAAIFGLAQEDDDGNAASAKPAAKPTAPGKADDKTLKRIYAKAKGLGYSDDQLKRWLLKKWNVDHTGDLTQAQADEAVAILAVAEREAEMAAKDGAT